MRLQIGLYVGADHRRGRVLQRALPHPRGVGAAARWGRVRQSLDCLKGVVVERRIRWTSVGWEGVLWLAGALAAGLFAVTAWR